VNNFIQFFFILKWIKFVDRKLCKKNCLKLYKIFLDYESIYKKLKVIALVFWEQWKRKYNNDNDCCPSLIVCMLYIMCITCDYVNMFDYSR